MISVWVESITFNKASEVLNYRLCEMLRPKMMRQIMLFSTDSLCSLTERVRFKNLGYECLESQNLTQNLTDSSEVL